MDRGEEMNAIPKVNIRPRFDFDSDTPVAGEVQKPNLGIMPAAIDYLFAFDIILIGWWLADWWYHSGWVWMERAFFKWLPWLMYML